MCGSPSTDLPNTQDELPNIRTEIERVGVEGVRTPLVLEVAGLKQSPICRIDVRIDLDGSRKGVHMSRLVESVVDAASRSQAQADGGLEHLGVTILEGLAGKHAFNRGEVVIRTTLALPRSTPATSRGTVEAYPVEVRVSRLNGRLEKRILVKVLGSTLCPHSLAITGGRAHSQRAEISLAVETELQTPLSIPQLIAVCEESLSAPAYTVLKARDERAVVDQMYNNPRLVEDVVRECLQRLILSHVKGRVHIKAVAFESIHRHNAVSEIIRDLKE